MFTGGKHRHPSLVRGPVNSNSSHKFIWLTDLSHRSITALGGIFLRTGYSSALGGCYYLDQWMTKPPSALIRLQWFFSQDLESFTRWSQRCLSTPGPRTLWTCGLCNLLPIFCSSRHFVFPSRCSRAINLLKNGPTVLPLWFCFIMRKENLLVRFVDWLVIPYNVSLTPLISPGVQQFISSVFFMLPGKSTWCLDRGHSPSLLSFTKTLDDEKKLKKIWNRWILQSSSFMETAVQMKYQGLWLFSLFQSYTSARNLCLEHSWVPKAG